MFVFQMNVQKQFEQQASTKAFTGAEAQKLLKVLGPMCDQMLSAVYK